jgi:hypothetical protein
MIETQVPDAFTKKTKAAPKKAAAKKSSGTKTVAKKTAKAK